MQFIRIYEQYQIRENEYHDKVVQPLWEKSAEMHSMWRAEDADRVAIEEEFARLNRQECARARDELAAIERLMFDELAPCLSEAQLAGLTLVRHQRERTRHYSEERFPGVNIDLVSLLYELADEDFLLPAAADTDFWNLVNAYDVDLTARIRTRFSEGQRLIAKAAIAEARQIAVQDETDRPWAMTESQKTRAREFARLRKECHRDLLRLDRSIHDLNSQHAEMLALALPEATGAEFRASFHAAVYDAVYPDWTDASEVIDAAAAIPGLSPEQYADIEGVNTWYQSVREGLCRRMVERYLEWKSYFALEWGYDQRERSRYDLDMRKLHADRINAARLACDQLAEKLTTEQMAEIAEVMDDYQARIETREYSTGSLVGR